MDIVRVPRPPEPPIFTVCTSGKGFSNRVIGDTIQFFERSKFKVNHAAIIYWSIELRTWMTVGANANGVTEMPLGAFAAERNLDYLFGATGWSLWDGLRAHVSDIDKHYNYAGLFGMAFVEIAEKLGMHPQHNLLNDREDLYCSEWVDEIADSGLLKAGMLDRWPLARTDAAIVDPARLCAAEIASPLFSIQHPSVFQCSWTPA